MVKKFFFILLVVLLLGFLYSAGGQIYSSLQADKRLEGEIEDLAKLQKHNSELKKRLAEVQGISFVEEQARNKLNFSRPGETVVIIPPEEIDKILSLENPVPEIKLPNWQGWLKLFWK
ncbi:MAG: septum formation initiator family protein [bacterium]|nr:septum formation initiator family protein [bacterium]